MSTETAEKLATANRVLASFAPETRIEHRRCGWYVVWNRWDSKLLISRRWQCRKGQDFYPVWYQQWVHGGTACTALSQLIRWLRGQPVLPASSWWYWASEKLRLLPVDAVKDLIAGGYPEHAACVLCGDGIRGGLDWWNLNGVSGPCCHWKYGCGQTGQAGLRESERELEIANSIGAGI